jgi:hypothetical protein
MNTSASAGSTASSDSELLHDDDQTRAVAIAYHAAANCVAFYFGAGVDSLLWPSLGFEERDDFKTLDRQEIADKLAGFIRSNKRAPAESLYRYAHGQNIHDHGVEVFDAADMPYRVAYQVFFETLLTVDDAIAVERDARGPVLAAALSERPEDTILEEVADPLALRTDMLGIRTGDDNPVHDQALTHSLESPHPHVAAAAAEKADTYAERRGYGSSSGAKGRTSASGRTGAERAEKPK